MTRFAVNGCIRGCKDFIKLKNFVKKFAIFIKQFNWCKNTVTDGIVLLKNKALKAQKLYNFSTKADTNSLN